MPRYATFYALVPNVPSALKITLSRASLYTYQHQPTIPTRTFYSILPFTSLGYTTLSLYYPPCFPPPSIEEILASMWNALSLTENEAITLNIDELKLSLPKFALIGKLVMKKNTSTVDVDKFLQGI